MVKKDRFCGGCTTELAVPAPRHLYAIPSDLEGSDSSGQVDTEVMALEDSRAPMRKCIVLNADGQESFLVPTQVFPVSNISWSERKDLALRLRHELDQIKVLQRRLEFQKANGVTLSSSNSILGCSNIKNPSSIVNAKKSLILTYGQDKNSDSLPHKSSGENLECAQKASAPGKENAMIMKRCEALLGRLMNHQYGGVFNTPVDVVKWNIPDYLSIIKHPMDLGTIKNNMSSGLYSSPLDFAADVRLTFSNAKQYNPPKNDVHLMADTLSEFFEVRWKAIEKKISSKNSQILPSKSSVPRETETAKPMNVSKKAKTCSMQDGVRQKHVQRIMTDQEKRSLGRELEALLGELPLNITDFLKAHSSSGKETAEDEIEIDIDVLSDETLFTLQKLLRDYLQDKQNSAKAKPCEIELLNELGPSNSSMQLCKVNLAEDDVDLGGIEPPVSSCLPVRMEPPVSSCLPVRMENDTDHSSKCISPEFSAGNYDSNSRSSESGIDVAKASSPPNGKLATRSAISKNASFGTFQGEHEPHSCLDKPELNSQQKPTSVDSTGEQDGEKTQCGRHVSPTKFYRAALLKNRFVDTILKAQEKTLKQGEKGDPERLRHQREELEMQKKKEKARLEAEVKAAEDARRKAEAEAAAEAKRKRELQREAAREALQKMERTVEINENCGFLEDLERLGAVPPEHLLSSVGETSPELSQEGMGSFNFGCSNPLEKLGLYMKMDEEDEDGEPPDSPNMVNDMEEGEID